MLLNEELKQIFEDVVDFLSKLNDKIDKSLTSLVSQLFDMANDLNKAGIDFDPKQWIIDKLTEVKYYPKEELEDLLETDLDFYKIRKFRIMIDSMIDVIKKQKPNNILKFPSKNIDEEASFAQLGSAPTPNVSFNANKKKNNKNKLIKHLKQEISKAISR